MQHLSKDKTPRCLAITVLIRYSLQTNSPTFFKWMKQFSCLPFYNMPDLRITFFSLFQKLVTLLETVAKIYAEIKLTVKTQNV